MTKQFEAKVALASGRNPGISRALGDCSDANYAASKHGVIGLTRTNAFKYATAGLRIIAVHPSIIEIPMVEATVSLWLNSPDASFVADHAPAGNGGRLI